MQAPFIRLENIIKYLWFVKQKNHDIFISEIPEFQGGVGAVGFANIEIRLQSFLPFSLINIEFYCIISKQ